MKKFITLLCMGVTAVFLLSGCNGKGYQTVKPATYSLEDQKIMITGAPHRMIFRKNETICAEPSPDVAESISKGFNAALTAAVQGLPSGVSPEAAASFGTSAAKSMAQLGERLGTIQLLRDGLYRACEAHSNNALSEASYAVLLSRYDDVMVTLLSTEIAGGAFGRSLAGISGEADSEASAKSDRKVDFSTERTLISEMKHHLKTNEQHETTLKKLIEERGRYSSELENIRSENTDGALNQEEADIKNQLDETLKQISDTESEIESKRNEVTKIQNSLESKLETLAKNTAASKVTTGGSITPGTQDKELANVLEEIQKNYIENVNADAIRVACVTALSNQTPKNAALVKLCQVQGDDNPLKRADKLQENIFNKTHEYRLKKIPGAMDVEKALAQAEKAKQEAKKLEMEARLISLKSLVSSTPSTAMSRNMVKSLQIHFNTLDKTANLQLTGVMDENTRTIVRNFQRKHGLKQDGIVGPKTLAKLFDELGKR